MENIIIRQLQLNIVDIKKDRNAWKKYVLFCSTQQTHKILPLPVAVRYAMCVKNNMN
jgi:hypothetical protein